MVCIQTKYIPATNTKPSRIKAFTCNGQRIYLSKDYGLTTEEEHAKAAAALLIKNGWAEIPNQLGQLDRAALVCGATKDGYAFVIVPRLNITWDGLGDAYTTDDFIRWGLMSKKDA